MRRLILFVVVLGCGSHAVIASSSSTSSEAGGSSAPVVVSPECTASRELRAKAVLLDHDGHEMLALAKLQEANAKCASEKPTSAELEKAITATLANDAPSKGTDVTMRAKMHEAYAAERAKDWAKAKGLYLDAWAEHHPIPRALEDAGRMAGLAGDAAESRRLRDRALAEAEAAEHTVAQIATPVHIASGSAELVGTTLMLASAGRVVGRDTVTGELRVLLDTKGKNTTLSPWGTLAVSGGDLYAPSPLSVYDVLTGTRLFVVARATDHATSPHDARMVVREETPAGATDAHAAVYDLATGEMKRITIRWTTLVGFGPDDSHVLVSENDPSGSGSVVRQVDLDKNAYTALHIAQQSAPSALSSNGGYLAYLDVCCTDAAVLHVHDLAANKEITQWTAKFHSVARLALSPDAKTVATASYSSVRLWDVAQKKQLWKREGESGSGTPGVFDDEGKSLVVGDASALVAWDVATGKEKPLIPDETPKNVLHVVKTPTQAGGGVALVLEDEVRLVPASGDPRTVCRGESSWRDATMIGPTSVAFSPSGKSFACAMREGGVHVFDTATWTEKPAIKHSADSPIDRPVDLVFSADDATLTDVSNVGFVVYDAATGKEKSHVSFQHMGQGFAPRHARFTDGSVAVRTWSGMAAIFAADGTWQRDVKLVASAPPGALDAFAASGKTYAVALGKTLHVVDLTTGDDKTTELPAKAKSVAVSDDGKTVLVAAEGGDVMSIEGGAATAFAHAKGVRVGFAGKATLVWSDKTTVEAYTSPSDAPITLDVDASGLVVRDQAGAFDTRGKPEAVCVVGSTYLSRVTCDDRAKDGLVAKWMEL